MEFCTNIHGRQRLNPTDVGDPPISAFDSVDHSMLISRLRQWERISWSALEQFFSCRSAGSFSVVAGNYAFSSETHLISHFERICYHCYADDVQIYISFKPQNVAKFSLLYKISINAIKKRGQRSFYS